MKSKRPIDRSTTPRVVNGAWAQAPLVYLCGAIGDRSIEEASAWRLEAAISLAPEFGVIDPLRGVTNLPREHVASGRFRPSDTARVYTDAEIVERDLLDVRRSRLVLRHYDGASEGSPMECAYAKMYGVPVIVSGIEDPRLASPWLRYHSVKILPTLGSAIEYIKRFWG